MKTLIVIPAYNEEATLAQTVFALQGLGDGFEILVVNDGSSDRTAEIAEQLSQTSRLRTQVIHLPTKTGIGRAVQAGYCYAARRQDFDYVMQFDADGQHDATYVQTLLDACRSRQLDLCVGSRFLDDKADGFRSTILRRVGIRLIAWLIRIRSGSRVTDPTSGFRCAGRRAWTHFAQYYPRDCAAPRSLLVCAHNNLHVGEIPVRMHPRQGGVSSIGRIQAIDYVLKVLTAILISDGNQLR